MENAPASLAPAPEEAPSGWRAFGRRLAGIVDQPVKTLQEVYQQPRGAWVGPLLLIILSLVVVTLVSLPYTLEMARAEVERQLQNMSPAQADLLRQTMQQISGGLLAVTTILGGLLSLGIALLAATVVLYFAGLIAGAELNFVPLLPVTIWCWLPFALRSLTQAGVIYARRGLIVNEGLSWLVSVGDRSKDSASFLYYLLGYLSVFTLWHLFLVWAAARGAGRASKTQAAIVTAAYAALSLGLGWIPLVVTRLFSPAVGG